MTPAERDALIDATVEACAKIAENFSEYDDASARRFVEMIRAEIAAAIRKEFAKP